MNHRQTVLLIDPDFRRRVAVSYALAGNGIHVEPFEGAAEILLHWPRAELAFACDEGEAVRELLTRMVEQGKWLPLITYAPAPSTPRVVQAILAGALDYLHRPFGEAEVGRVIAEAAAAAGPASNARLREAIARSRIQKLTRREREVLAAVAEGLSNRLISERLSISPRTVEIRRANMMTKLGANHTSEAIRIAIEAALAA